MSLHVFTPLNSNQVAAAVMRALPLAKIDIHGDSVIVSQGRHQISLILEECGPFDTSYPAVRTKVSIYSVQPQEREKPLEISMNEEERLAQTIRIAVEALNPVETVFGNGQEVSPEALGDY